MNNRIAKDIQNCLSVLFELVEPRPISLTIVPVSKNSCSETGTVVPGSKKRTTECVRIAFI